MCHCWSLKPLGSVIVYWVMLLRDFIQHPGREMWSELCFATAYLHSYFILLILQPFGFAKNIVYIGLPGDEHYINCLKEKFVEYNCIRGSRYLTAQYCPSHYYSYSINT
jgi:hypothetical protein